MIDCNKVGTKLLDYIDKELDPKAAAEIEKHLELCRKCFDVNEFENLLRDHLRNKTEHCCPEKLKKRITNILNRF